MLREMYTPTTSGADDSLTESKFTVAGILSSMANGHGLSPFSDPGPSFASAVASVNTPVLTPSTLANLEQTFIELTAVQSQAPTQVTDLSTTSNQLGARQSGFVPPVVDPNVLAGYTDDSSSDQDWYPTAKRSRTEVNITSSAIVIAPDSTGPSKRRTPGPRRSRNEQLTPEEEQRRRLRRERNKLAAAKCRQRRVDQTNALTNETEELEEEKASLETEVESLQQVKEHLEFVLEAHRPLCNKHILKIPQEIKSEPESSPAAASVVTTTRPTSLPLSTRSLPIIHPTGVAITTPSSVITTLGLDNLVDHTGLTPITGGPSNCSSEVQRGSDSSSPGEHLGSPTRLMAL